MHAATIETPTGAPCAERTDAPIFNLPPPRPDRATIDRFVRALFKHADPQTFVSLRGLEEGRNDRPPLFTAAVGADDLATIVNRAVYHAGIVAEGRGVFAPPICVFQSTALFISCTRLITVPQRKSMAGLGHVRPAHSGDLTMQRSASSAVASAVRVALPQEWT